MDRVLTIAEIEAQFASEWILVEDPQTSQSLEVLGGIVRFHSKDRDEVYRKQPGDSNAEAFPFSVTRCHPVLALMGFWGWIFFGDKPSQLISRRAGSLSANRVAP